MPLEAGVVDENLEAAEFVHRPVHRALAERRVAHVAGQKETAAAYVFDGRLGFDGVGLLGLGIDDGNVGAFARIEHGDGATNARVAALAEALGRSDDTSLLQQTLDEEAETDAKLTRLALTIVNPDAGDETSLRNERGSSTRRSFDETPDTRL